MPRFENDILGLDHS